MINAFKPYAPILFSTPQPILTPESLNRDINPRPIHSHNDYWRKSTHGGGAFIEAVKHGAMSIESDVWVFDKTYTVSRVGTDTPTTLQKNEVYVGHNHIYLKEDETLDSLYLQPMMELLDYANPSIEPKINDEKYGIYFNSPETPTYFWMDFKTDAQYTYEIIKPHFQEFIDKGYLAYYDHEEDKFVSGPIIVTITGNIPDIKDKKQYFFIDGPLHKFEDMSHQELKELSKVCKVASASQKQIDDLHNGLYSTKLFTLAHEYGMKTRVWGGRSWPRSEAEADKLRGFQSGCDFINSDDLTFGG
ncbi:hypothetical protein CLIB1444_23S00584 [[Candida] jaroonii]|uniref:Uncharacterized protein n=1 Tax=[Candida] jaroonii TaxID=467808 RepID=A0ACA9YG49_9ASCO|nr:hypothetical protein CLIB1444_23S00584 [[Candida] jaroonii]